MKSENYQPSEHIHRFAVWTAARAVQRGFTTTANISYVINNSSLMDFTKIAINSSAEYDVFHKKCANEIIKLFKDCKNKRGESVVATYGQAAKIISIYLKTVIIITSSCEDSICNYIHPPIDNILLKAISKEVKVKQFNTIKWTQLNMAEYWDLVSNLKKSVKEFNWRIEEFWKPEKEKNENK